MPHLIAVKNDKPTTILSPKDFEDLIAEHMDVKEVLKVNGY